MTAIQALPGYEGETDVNKLGNETLEPMEVTARLRGGELPATLPLEGWTKVTLHGQVDAVGPSDLHPDLSKVEVSLPPGVELPASAASPCDDRPSWGDERGGQGRYFWWP
ncbi:hypothetical protein ACWGMW_16275 [Streptomyces albidoflavus]